MDHRLRGSARVTHQLAWPERLALDFVWLSAGSLFLMQILPGHSDLAPMALTSKLILTLALAYLWLVKELPGHPLNDRKGRSLKIVQVGLVVLLGWLGFDLYRAFSHYHEIIHEEKVVRLDQGLAIVAEHDFSKENLMVGGEWQFYPNSFGKNPFPRYLGTGEPWVERYGDLPARGFATFRGVVKFGKALPNQRLRITCSYLPMASRIRINGQTVCRGEQISRADDGREWARYRAMPSKTFSGQAVLAIELRLSNFNSIVSDPKQLSQIAPLRIGLARSEKSRFEQEIFGYQVFALGSGCLALLSFLLSIRLGGFRTYWGSCCLMSLCLVAAFLHLLGLDGQSGPRAAMVSFILRDGFIILSLPIVLWLLGRLFPGIGTAPLRRAIYVASGVAIYGLFAHFLAINGFLGAEALTYPLMVLSGLFACKEIQRAGPV